MDQSVVAPRPPARRSTPRDGVISDPRPELQLYR